MSYDPILRARRDALKDLEEDLDDKDYEVAIRAIDKFFDYIDAEMQHADKMVRNQETGALTVITSNHDSNS